MAWFKKSPEEQIWAAAQELPAASAEGIERNFREIETPWGAKEIETIGPADLRERVSQILTRYERAGFTEVKVRTDTDREARVSYVQVDTFHPAPLWRPFRIGRVTVNGVKKYALYGHVTIY